MEIDGLRGLTEDIVELRLKIVDLTKSVDALRAQLPSDGGDSATTAEIRDTVAIILDVLAERLPKPP